MSPLFVPLLIQINPIHTVPSAPGFSKLSISFRFIHQDPICVYFLPHTYHRLRPTHSAWFEHPNTRIIRSTNHYDRHYEICYYYYYYYYYYTTMAAEVVVSRPLNLPVHYNHSPKKLAKLGSCISSPKGNNLLLFNARSFVPHFCI
jgi:hypothetical protein